MRGISKQRLGASVVLVFVSSILPGCGEETTEPAAAPAPVVSSASSPAVPEAKPEESDPDDVPITEADVVRPKDFPDAIARISGYRDRIRDEIAAGRPTKAHRSLDELDIVLKRLPEIARDGGVPKSRWEDVNTTAQRIRGLFDQVHSRIDAKQDPNYGSVSGDIDSAVDALRKIEIPTGAPATEKSK